jgi:hypothetical protein
VPGAPPGYPLDHRRAGSGRVLANWSGFWQY